MRSLRAVGFRLLAFLAAAGAVAAGLAVDRLVRGHDRALAQELVIHHFERSAWFAMKAPDYEGIDPELARRFRESAAWHARRAREFQRMDPGAAARESGRDLDREVVEGRLLERALRCDAILAATRGEATPPAGDGAGDEPATSPGGEPRAW